MKKLIPAALAWAILTSLIQFDAAAQDSSKKSQADKQKEPLVEMSRDLSRDEARQDLAQFREILKREWILANLNDADFDAALDQIERDVCDGLSVAEMALRLHRVLCLGRDGHAEMQNVLPAFYTVTGISPKFLIDVCGDRYITYIPEYVAPGPVNPTIKYRFVLLRDGYPYLESIDGVPIETWVNAVDPYVPRAPKLARRWHCMDYLTLRFPYFRSELKLPQSPRIGVRLVSEDGMDKIDIDAPTFSGGHPHYNVPKPEWEILAGEIGYLSLINPAADGTALIIATMPKMRSTKGLVLDLRGNTGGGGTEFLKFMASYLVSPQQPRVVVGQFVRWKDSRKTGWMDGTPLSLDGLDEEARAAVEGLTEQGRATLSEVLAHHRSAWKPPAHRETATACLLLARPEAEPAIFPYNHPKFPKDTYYYNKPVVVLFDHRCFSAGEIFLAGVRCLPNVTLIGSPITACGGGSTNTFYLANSGLRVCVTDMVFVPANGQLIDGIGLQPDIVAEPEMGYYLGTSDRMLEKAIGVLKEKFAEK
jgi:hypothetical protein